MAVIVQWQNAGLWIRMSWVRPPLAAPGYEIKGSLMRPFLLPKFLLVTHEQT